VKEERKSSRVMSLLDLCSARITGNLLLDPKGVKWKRKKMKMTKKETMVMMGLVSKICLRGWGTHKIMSV